MEDAEIIEKLAALEHEQWQKWSEALWSEIRMWRRELAEALDQDAVIRAIDERQKRWEKNWIPYDALPEKVKEQDRVWARKALNIVDEGMRL